MAFAVFAGPFIPAEAAGDFAELERIRARIEGEGLHWTAGETSVSALSPERRRARLMTVVTSPEQGAPASVYEGSVPLDVHPDAPIVETTAERFNWADVDDDDWTTPVKDQGDCGSCAVFAATAVTEARANVSAGMPDLDLDLAEQSLLSCTTGSSCSLGTWETTLFVPTLRDQGIPDELCHPYSATDGNCADQCADVDSRKFRIVGGAWLPSSGMLTAASEEDIKAGLVSGPVYANMMVPDDFFYYTGGVYEGSIAPLSWHTVAIVGWDDHSSDASPASWIVKNSWGTGWGMDGFFEIKRGDATLIGAQTTALEVDAAATLGGIICPVVEPDLVTLVDDSGESAERSFALELCEGAESMPFRVEAPAGIAPWLEVSALAGEIPADGGVDVGLTYSEAGFGDLGEEWQDLHVIGTNGQSRHLRVGCEVVGAADADSDSDADSDTDADTDGNADLDGGADDGDGSGCGCASAGSGHGFSGGLVAGVLRISLESWTEGALRTVF